LKNENAFKIITMPKRRKIETLKINTIYNEPVVLEFFKDLRVYYIFHRS